MTPVMVAVLVAAFLAVVGVGVALWYHDMRLALIGYASVVGLVAWVLVFVEVLDSEGAKGMWLYGSLAVLVGGGTGVAAWWFSVDVDGGPQVDVDPCGNKLDIIWMNSDALADSEFTGGVPRERHSTYAGGYSTARVVRGILDPWAFERDDDAVPELIAPWRDGYAPDEAEAGELKIEKHDKKWKPIVDAYPAAKRGHEEAWREGKRTGERLASRDINDALGETNTERRRIEEKADRIRKRQERIEERELRNDEDDEEEEGEVEDADQGADPDPRHAAGGVDENEAFSREAAADGGDR